MRSGPATGTATGKPAQPAANTGSGSAHQHTATASNRRPVAQKHTNPKPALPQPGKRNSRTPRTTYKDTDMTAARDTKPRHLTVVADTPQDNRHLPPSQPVHRRHARRDPDPPLRVRTRTTTPAVDHRIPDRAQRWSFRHWAVAFTVLAQLAIGAAINAGGDPTMGIAAALIMALCGAALIAAEATTNQTAPATNEAETDQQPADSRLNEETDS